jgi:hypothetical protein
MCTAQYTVYMEHEFVVCDSDHKFRGVFRGLRLGQSPVASTEQIQNKHILLRYLLF